MKSAKLNCKTLLAPIEDIATRVREQRNRLKGALASRLAKDQREIEKAQKAKDGEMESAKAKGARDSQTVRSAGAKSTTLARTYEIFSRDLSGLNPVVTKAYSDFDMTRARNFMDEPLILTDWEEFGEAVNEMSGYKESLKAFKDDWEASPQRKPGGTGRAARLVAPTVNTAF